MGFQFNKRINLGGGVRLNLSKSGVGLSAGVKGFRIGTGPRGTKITTSIPGTGISYTKSISTQPKSVVNKSDSISDYLELPVPSIFAPKHEKDLINGFKAFLSGNHSSALTYFRSASEYEAAALFMSAFILFKTIGNSNSAISDLEKCLEKVTVGLEPFTSTLFRPFLNLVDIEMPITRYTTIIVYPSPVACLLLLVELYQKQGRLLEAITLLETFLEGITELENMGEIGVTDHQAEQSFTILSLCELYAGLSMWDEIIRCAEQVYIHDDITLEISIWHGRALQKKGLHFEAIGLYSVTLTDPTLNPILMLEARYWRAISYKHVGLQEDAKEDLLSIYAQDPSFHDVAKRLNL